VGLTADTQRAVFSNTEVPLEKPGKCSFVPFVITSKLQA